MLKKKMYILIAVIVLALTLLGIIYSKNIERLMFASTLFSGAEQYENFNRVADFYPVSTMRSAAKPFDFPDGDLIKLPTSFTYNNMDVDVDGFIKETDTSSLLVLHEGKVVFEQYMLTGGRDVNWLSMSVAKSFIATAIGIAVDEGLIDIQKAITDYVPSLLGSAYDNVRVKDVLQMSSGAEWNEDYSDPNSDINSLAKIMAFGGSFDEFTAGLVRDNEPGTLNHYNSADTQALGMLLARATEKSVTEYIEEKLWRPLGMESNGYWILDDHNVEMAFGGLNATARDYAKLGELHLQKGKWQGKQIVSEEWVNNATTPDAPHVMPGANPAYPLGYGYQWWIPASDEGEYSAVGVYNQFIYVNPARALVLVKLSAYSDYGVSLEESAYRELETMEFFREIGRQF